VPVSLVGSLCLNLVLIAEKLISLLFGFMTFLLMEISGTRVYSVLPESAYSIKPKFTLSKTKYLMNDKANEDRSIYSFNIDSKLLLERNTYLFGKNSIQTLTPRLAYNYTPERNQSALANFDSEKINESYENLFSGKKFTGLDRISKTNDIVIGLESDFINKKTGATYLTLKKMLELYIERSSFTLSSIKYLVVERVNLGFIE
jgi:LPS-assembly protein